MLPALKDIYFKPIAPNLASIDSTIADAHRIKIQSINDVWDAIPADSKRDGRLLFVISERSRLKSVQRHTGAVREIMHEAEDTVGVLKKKNTATYVRKFRWDTGRT